MSSSIMKILKKPSLLFLTFGHMGFFDWMDDADYLKIAYKVRTGKQLNIQNPIAFSEKIQWLKINDRKAVYTTMVDKYEAKKYVSDRIGKDYIIPTIGVWNSFDEIDFKALPDRFVLKCTHDSGGLIICKNKKEFQYHKAKELFSRCLKHSFLGAQREWPYKNVKPRIIAEEYLENGIEGLHDYKVWCFNGEPRYIQYITGRVGNTTREAFYDVNWVKKDFTYHNPPYDGEIAQPDCLCELLSLAKTLSTGVPFLRCDFYILNDGSIKFGEMTFYPMSGLENWKPNDVDSQLGALIKLPYEVN